HRVDTGFLDVLHDAAQVQLLAVVEGIDVDFDRLVQEPVHQHRGGQDAVPGIGAGGAGDIVHQLVGVVDDLHPAPAEHVGGAHQYRVADPGGDIAGLIEGLRGAELRGVQTGLQQHLPEVPAVLGRIDRLRRSAPDRQPC